MTLFVVLGDGEMPPKEVTHQLDDLWKKCEEEDTDFWFALEGKAVPTETDKALVQFFNKYGIYYGLFVTPGAKPSDEYTDASEYFDVDDVPTGVRSLMQASKQEGEDAVLLTLFTDDEAADAILIDTSALVLQDKMTVLGLNDALEPVVLLTEEVKELPAEAVESKPKKGALKPVADEDEDEDEAAEPEPLTREYLELLTANEVKEIAKGMGLTPGTKAETINTILGEVNEEVNVDTAFSEPVPPDDTPVTAPVPEQRYASEHQFDSEAVLVVVHTQNGMFTKWTTLSKLENL